MKKFFKILMIVFVVVQFGIKTNGQTVRGTLFQDANNDWSIGGTGENLEIREPEQSNKVWATFIDDKALHLSGTPNLYVDGKIGIGTNNPLNELHIKNYINNSTWTSCGIRLQHFDDYPGVLHNRHWLINSTTTQGNINNILEFKNGESTSPTANPTMTTKAYLDWGGNFYASSFIDIDGGGYFINPSSTITSLKVAGKIQTCSKIEAEEIEVKNICAVNINVDVSNVADYVFEEGYKLNSIYELEQFIKKNKHLPGIPAGSEFEEKGMNVADMNNLLLQKIEELSLYIIDLKKENEKLSKRIEILEQ